MTSGLSPGACSCNWSTTNSDTISLIDDEIVNVIVGTEIGSPKKFSVHANILKARSSFFDVRLSERWNESKKDIELPDHTEAFQTFVDWAYRNNISNDIFDSDEKALTAVGAAYKLGHFISAFMF